MEKGSKKRKAAQLWLLKTEPGEWSWEEQRRNGGVSKWDGVRNRQAQGYLRSMTPGDLCLFYHSGGKSPAVVGVVEVTRPWYEEDEGGGAVDVREVGKMKREVGLREIRAEGERVKGFALVRQPRLSVLPVPPDVWERICDLGGGYEDGGDGDQDDGGEGKG